MESLPPLGQVEERYLSLALSMGEVARGWPGVHLQGEKVLLLLLQ